MNNAVQQTVHESETQRQYVRVPMPVRALINGRSFEVKDLSSGGIGITGIKGEFEKGGTLPLTLVFPFSDFALDLKLDTQIQNYDPRAQLLGVRFIDLTPAKISLVNNVIRSFIAGEVVSANEMLEISKRDDFVKIRQQKNDNAAQPVQLGQNLIPMAMFGLLGLAATYLIALNIYASIFVVASNLGVVKAETLPLSPAVMELVKPDAVPYVEIFLPPAQAERLSINDRASVKVIGEDADFEGVIREIIFDEAQLANAQSQASLMIKVIIEPTETLPHALIGKPVKTTFDLF